MNLSQDDWVQLSRLLDTALELPDDERSAWLDHADVPSAHLKQRLRDMLADLDNETASPGLATLPDFSAAEIEPPQMADHEILGRVVGPYSLRRELGRGGMSTVFLASRTDESIKRSVALKLPHVHYDRLGFSERFVRERDILAQLAHPHIARLYDAGVTTDGQPFLAMEYIDGRPLTEFCDELRYELRARVELFLQVLAAVQYAHTHLVIHRDLKPSNILVDRLRQVHLLDFGIAKILSVDTNGDAAVTEFGARAMTPDYAAPEQIAGEALSTVSDVYSLGVVLYELLAGSRPYRLKRTSRGALEEAILSDGVVRPSLTEFDAKVASNRNTTTSRLRAQLQGDLDAVVLQALKRDPVHRYASADAFSRDLQQYLAGRPVLAKGDSAAYRLRKFLRRNQLAVAAAATVVAALVIGFGTAVWQAGVARREAATARQQTGIALAEAHTAQSVLEFMENMFKANSENQADAVKARQTTARELLDVGAAQIETALQDAPTAKLDVLRTLGNMYDELGLSERGLQLQRERVALGRQSLRNDDPALAKLYADYANAAERLDMHDQAEPAFLEAEAILGRAHDTKSAIWAQLEISLAFFYEATNPKLASAYAQRGVSAWRQFGDSNNLVNALSEQAYNDIDFGDFQGAEQAAREALSVAARVGAEANDQISSLNEARGYAESGLDDMAAAERSFRRAADLAAGTADNVLLSTLEANGPLGDFLYETARTDEGLSVLSGGQKLVLTVTGLQRTTSLPIRTTMRYGRALIEHGRIEEGFKLVQSASSTLATRANDPLIGLESQVLDATAQALIEFGRYSEAEATLSQAAELHRRTGEADTPFGNRNLAEHARVLMLLKRTADAEHLIDHYWVGPQLQPAARPALERRLLYAELCMARADATGAQAWASQVRALAMVSLNRSYLKSWEGRADLLEGQALRAEGHAPAALPLLESALGLIADQHDRRSSVNVAEAEVALAECLLDLKQRSSAHAHWYSAKAIYARHPQLGSQYTGPLARLKARFR